MYNADNDAQEIARELTKQSSDFHVLSDILPGLSHDQMMELHTAYKRVAKFQGRGINIAKHIRLKVPGHLRTIAYVTALGRWESEGYWANYWYQSNSSKRELLIESLMGRSNQEIHLIKENFRDKRYGDSLVRCMDKELPANKFRTAILMALEEDRQPEKEVWGRDRVEKDAEVWARSLRRREGGESAMLEICVMRSDRHLRECMRVFDKREGSNFAKQALEHSGNLVVRLQVLSRKAANRGRARSWRTSSTASSTGRRATRCCCTTRSRTWVRCATGASPGQGLAASPGTRRRGRARAG
jgi:hypothetical protein